MPNSEDYIRLYAEVCSKFNPSPVERLQMAMWIDILARLEKIGAKANGTPRKARRSERYTGKGPGAEVKG